MEEDRFRINGESSEEVKFLTKASVPGITQEDDSLPNMESSERKSLTGFKTAPGGLDSVLPEIGSPGRFIVLQLVIHFSTCYALSGAVLIYVFIGYEPPHTCSHVTNVTSLLSSVGLDNTSDIEIIYGKCVIQLVQNVSGVIKSVAELGCVAGNDFKGGKHVSFIAEWDMVCNNIGLGELAQTILMIGQTVGAVFFTSLADRFGRKIVCMVCNALIIASGIGVAYSPNIFVLLVFRFFVGFFQQGMGCVGYTMIVELLTPRFRKNIGVLGGFNWTISVLTLGLVAYLMQDYSWRMLQLVVALFSCSVLLFPFFIWESPRWLVANKKYNEALKFLEKACVMSGKDFERVKESFQYHVVQHEQEVHIKQEMHLEQEICIKKDMDLEREICIKQEKGINQLDDTTADETSKVVKYNITDILRHKTLLVTSLVIWFAWITNTITYYGLFLTSSSLVGNRYVNFILMGLVDIPGDISNLFLLHFFGRKTVIMGLMTVAGTSLLTSTLLVALGTSNTAIIMSTVFSFIGKFGIGASFNTLFLYTPELFPTNLRSAGLGICSSVSRLGGMLVPYSNLLADMALWAPGTIFSAMCFISVVMFIRLPETRGRPLPNTIAEMKQWWS
ncbi:solute carrier family 22 member 6-A-like isoform X2 [Physella acuta]|uniref:solute carrier family 22 member 6-A-like isoform X2 n=1 Tax=Physella acuta TaxID=109671 RepID=UPI0027DBA30B|nr:solute carrier family 22 member 6-A-like isoform X2 [Physella acuta]